MPAKKDGAKKKKKEAEPDDSTSQLIKLYKKKLEAMNNLVPCKQFVEKIQQSLDDKDGNGHVKKFHIWEELGPEGTTAIFETLELLKYKHSKSLRLWKIDARDLGALAISKYMQSSNIVEKLDLLDNKITPLGCQYLSQAISTGSSLQKLKLDHNKFSNAGLQQLTKGLALNNGLISLSLNYCNIDASGVKYFQDILAFVDCKLEKLKLQGNFLKNQGVYDLFKGIELNDTLEKLNIADNQWGECETIPVIDKICEVMLKCKSLGCFKFKYNGLYDDSNEQYNQIYLFYEYQILLGCKRFMDIIIENKHIYKFEISEHVDNVIIAAIKKATKKRKPKKKKKSKKGKKKKKK